MSTIMFSINEKWSRLEGAQRLWAGMLLFVVLAFAVNYKFFGYDYHMDDAWVIAVNHQENSLFTREGVDEALGTLKKQYYYEQWQNQQRFVGIVPVLRFFEINAISADARVHQIINLAFHAFNALLLYLVLVRVLQANSSIALVFSGLFALGLNLDSGSYALSVWIGSFSVNLLTLLLLMLLAVSEKMAFPRRALWLLYGIYTVLALGNYAMAVILPPIAIVSFMAHRDLKRTIRYLLGLSVPIVLNLIVRSFAPPSKYVGTTLKLDATHIWHNLAENLDTLLGPELWFNAIIVALLVATLAYGLLKRHLSTLDILLPLSLLLGMTGLYSLSARNSFANPYFLYIPYAGLIMLLALATKMVVGNGKYKLIRSLGVLTVIAALAWFQIAGAKQYRQLRDASGDRTGEMRTHFNKIEAATRSEERNLVAILYDNIHEYVGALGYSDATINTWKSAGNKTQYILVSQVIPHENAGNVVVKTGYSQYAFLNAKFRTVDYIKKRFGINSNKFAILKVTDGKIEQLDPTPQKIGALLESAYGPEQYGDGKKYSWTDGNAKFNIYSPAKFAGRQAILSFTVISLFDDKIEVAYGKHRKIFDVTAQKPAKVYQQITLGGSQQVMLKAWKKSVPPGDVRNLSFRVDHDFDIRLIEKSLHLGKDLSGFELSGIYGLERDYFRWVQPEASIIFPGGMPSYRSAKLILRGSFPVGSAPLIMLNQSIVPTRTKRIDKTTVEYVFDGLDEELRVVTLRSKKYKTEHPEPRELGFMFNSLDIEFK